MTKIFKAISDYFKDSSLKRIYSPFRGNVMPSSLLRDVNLAKNVMGYSLGVIPENGEVRSPCKCRVTQISEFSNAFCLSLGKIQLIVNMGLNRDRYKREWFHYSVSPGTKIKRDVPIVTMDLEKIMSADPDFVCVLTVKHSKELKYISFANTRYIDFDTVLCSINVY